ncbi:hypothetical protein CCHR01_07562 [Colletotrichum chrysophilum]|uniref:Uncharacterized protein n=1 Tax=Colletotrichum chrysophilum TaxID=1836956 RepID=A0AAD9AQ99_9PEZI|nr:hypothetical protein CCHR01_07562 [Colletotrichum chrysophilum]
MQFSITLFALFVGIAAASPTVIEPRQNTACNLCREECFFGKGSNDVYVKCINRCNTDLKCTLTP